MAQSVDVLHGLGLCGKGRVLKGCRVCGLALGLAGRFLGDCAAGVYGLGLYVSSVVRADTGRSHGAVVFRPSIGGFAPAVARGRDGNALGIGKFFSVECDACGVDGFTGLRATGIGGSSADCRNSRLNVIAVFTGEDRLGRAVILGPVPYGRAVVVEYRSVGGVAGHGGDGRIPIREGVGKFIICGLYGDLVRGHISVFIAHRSLHAVDDPGYDVAVLFVLGSGVGIPVELHRGGINGISHIFIGPLLVRNRRIERLGVGRIVLAGEACAGRFIILAPGPDRFAPVMPQSGQGFAFSLGANKAGAGLDAGLRTGRRGLNDPIAPIVACCGDFHVSAVGAARAGVVGVPADLRTAYGLCVVMNEVVTEGGDGSSLHSLTDGAGTSLFTVFGTGGCCNLGPIAEAVSGCGNGLLFGVGILSAVEIHDSGMNDFPVRRAGDCSCCLAGNLGVHNFGVIRLGGAGKRRGGGGVIIRPGPGGFPETMGDDPEVSAEGSPIGNVAVFEINRDAAGMHLVHRVLATNSAGIPINNAVFIYVNDLDLVLDGKLGLEHILAAVIRILGKYLVLVDGVDIPAGPDQIVAVGQCAGIGRGVFSVADGVDYSGAPAIEAVGAVIVGLLGGSAVVGRKLVIRNSFICLQDGPVAVLPGDDDHAAFLNGQLYTIRGLVVFVALEAHIVGTGSKILQCAAADGSKLAVGIGAVLHLFGHAGDAAVPLPLVGLVRGAQPGGHVLGRLADGHSHACCIHIRIVFIADNLVENGVFPGVDPGGNGFTVARTVKAVLNRAAACRGSHNQFLLIPVVYKILRSSDIHFGPSLGDGHFHAAGSTVIVVAVAD